MFQEVKFHGFLDTVQDGGKVVSLTHRPSLPPVNAPGTHFLLEDSRTPQVFKVSHVLDTFW